MQIQDSKKFIIRSPVGFTDADTIRNAPVLYSEREKTAEKNKSSFNCSEKRY